MQKSLRALQHRRGKNLSCRNIDIGHTVLKARLFLRIPKLSEGNPKRGLISPRSDDLCIIAAIQKINELLLQNSPVGIVQRVDADNVPEERGKELPNLRERPGDDRKARLIARHILFCDFRELRHIEIQEPSLLLGKGKGICAAQRLKALLPEIFHHCRACIASRRLAPRLIGRAELCELPVCKCLVPEDRRIKAMIIIKLPVWT